MAASVEFEEANTVWRGWAEDEDRPAVDDLPAHQDEQRSISCWQLTAEELAEVARTGRVWLHVWGRQPPVYVGGDYPFVRGENGVH